MRMMKLASVLAVVGALSAMLPMTSLAAPGAQGSNLLTNPGFEEPYEDVRRGRRAAGWQQWYEDTGHEDPEVFRVEIELNPALVQEGRSSQHIGNKTFAWHAGMMQSLSVPAGTPVRFCAYGRVFVSNDDYEEAEGWSWDGFRSQMKVGIHPNGEVAWSDPGIIWSAEANPHTAWQQMCVDAQVGDTGKVTVLTSNDFRASAGAQGGLAYHVDAWWDNASLVATSAAPTAAPTQAPPAAAPHGQQPQAGSGACETRPDGSVVYVVKSGDTLFAIATLCDSTVDDIRQLNGLTSDLISVGQTLIVKAPAGAAPPPTTAPAATAGVTATIQITSTNTTPTPEPTPTPADGKICVLAFNDANASQARDADEQLLGAVGFTLSDASGAITASYVTTGLEPEAYCFGGLQPGRYTVDARPPLGVQSTTSVQWPLGLTAGMTFDVAYGGSRNPVAAENVASGAEPTAAPEASSADSASADSTASSLGRLAMGVVGVIILLGAGFMAGLVLMRARK